MSLESLNEKQRRAWDAAIKLGRLRAGPKSGLGLHAEYVDFDAAFAALKPEPLVWRSGPYFGNFVRSDGVELSQIRVAPESICPEMPGILAALNRYEREKAGD